MAPSLLQIGPWDMADPPVKAGSQSSHPYPHHHTEARISPMQPQAPSLPAPLGARSAPTGSHPSATITPEKAGSSTHAAGGAAPHARRTALLHMGVAAAPGGANGAAVEEQARGREGRPPGPCVTWALLQHAWALGGLPRVHHLQRKRAKGANGEK